MNNHKTTTVNSSVDYSPIKNNQQEFEATTPNPTKVQSKTANKDLQSGYAKIKKFERF